MTSMVENTSPTGSFMPGRRMESRRTLAKQRPPMPDASVLSHILPQPARLDPAPDKLFE